MTWTDTEIRNAFIEGAYSTDAVQLREQVFDRWLAGKIRKAHRSGYEAASGDLVSGAFVGGPTFEAVKASYTGQRIAVEVRTELIKSVADEIRAEQVCGCVNESDNPLDWHEVCRGAEFAARLLEDRR